MGGDPAVLKGTAGEMVEDANTHWKADQNAGTDGERGKEKGETGKGEK